MRRETLEELHYIVATGNLPSIFAVGLLSHNAAAGVPHMSVADPLIQERREGKRVPQALPLHDYVNLYINARNTMMFKILRKTPPIPHEQVAVLGVSTDVLDLP